MALGAAGTALPSTGMGNIGSLFGTPNAPGIAAPTSPFGGAAGGMIGGAVRPPVPGNTPTAPTAPTMGNMGNIGNMFGGAQRPPVPSQGPMSGLAQIFSQLHPQTQQALRSIPPQALQQLHQAGLIHPGLVDHLRGGAMQ